MDIKDKQSNDENIKQKEIEKKKINNSSQISNTKKNNELKEKIFNNQKKIHEIKLRHLAYIENIKKNTEAEIKNIKNIKKEQFFNKIIPIIEILENILFFSKQSNLDQEPLIQGIKLILNSLFKIMYKFGVKIEGKNNEIFNPKIHHLILTQNSEEIKPNHVISVEKLGFSFNNIILRKAHVIISQN